MSRRTESTVDLAPIRSLVDRDDVDLGVTLLGGVPTNEGRSPEQLRQVSVRAADFGRSIAVAGPDSDGTDVSTMTVVERTGGLDPSDPVVARFLHKSRTIELFTDTVDFCEDLVDRLSWRELFPPGSVRGSALEHERAHDLISHHHARGLRVAVGHPILSIGRWRRFAHIAGAEEIAAHAFAQQSLGLRRSPLLVTAAAMAVLDASNQTSKES